MILCGISNYYYNLKIKGKTKQIEKILSDFFKSSVRLVPLFRKSSQDNIYNVLVQGKASAVVRVRNEFKLKALANSSGGYDRLLVKSKEKFQREWVKCQKAYQDFLTPEPLFKKEDFMVFRFVEGNTALEEIKKDVKRVESVFAKIIKAVEKLHRLGIFHGDLSIFNCIITGQGRCVFFDLEKEVPGFSSISEKKAYEYLHLIDTSLKFLPQKYKEIKFWVEILNKYMASKIEVVDIEYFRGRFKRLESIDSGLEGLNSFLKA
jgi:RIO-like serine/threonine protein kinase